MELWLVREEEDYVHVALSGRLYVVGRPELQTRFKDLTTGRGKHAIVDMSEVTFLASFGIRLLFQNAKLMAATGARMVLLNPRTLVAETLLTAGMSEITPVAGNVEQALEILRGNARRAKDARREFPDGRDD